MSIARMASRSDWYASSATLTASGATGATTNAAVLADPDAV